MSIERIIKEYDPENDAGPVSWADVAMADKIDKLLADVAVLKQHVGELQHELRSMREWNGRLLEELGNTESSGIAPSAEQWRELADYLAGVINKAEEGAAVS